MTIIKSSKQLDAMAIYRMTKSPEIVTAKSLADGEIITVVTWCLYSDVNTKGEPIDLLSLEDEKGQVYAVQSDTFKNSFDDCLEIMQQAGMPEDAKLSIKKVTGIAKSGREYINCVLVGF